MPGLLPPVPQGNRIVPLEAPKGQRRSRRPVGLAGIFLFFKLGTIRGRETLAALCADGVARLGTQDAFLREIPVFAGLCAPFPAQVCGLLLIHGLVSFRFRKDGQIGFDCIRAVASNGAAHSFGNQRYRGDPKDASVPRMSRPSTSPSQSGSAKKRAPRGALSMTCVNCPTSLT